MAYVTAHAPINISGEGNILGVEFDNFVVTTNTSSALSYHYTYGGQSVMDLTIRGSFAYSTINMSGSISSFSGYYPDGAPMVIIDSLNLSFTSLTDLSRKLVSSYMFRGSDVMVGSAHADVLVGRGGYDSIEGRDGADTLRGGDDADMLYGNQGADALYGDAGSDSLFGGQGSDYVEGGAGNDTIQGNMANDTLIGGDGSDALFGGQGDDELNGGVGSDTLAGNLGNDALIGGGGADRFVFSAGQGNDDLWDFSAAEGDRIQLAAGAAYTVTTTATGETAIVLATGEMLTLKGIAAAQVVEGWLVYV